MKKKSQALETVVHGVFLLLGLITVGCVLLISVYLIVSGIPAIRQIGLIPFLPLSALALGMNALMLGAFAAIYQQQGIGLGVYVLGVLPHGIFELSALILSCALGLLICRTGTERILKKSDTPFFRRVLDCIRVFLTFSVPLLLVAALIETYVTPALLNLVL
jgi:stage II sporulation protein M